MDSDEREEWMMIGLILLLVIVLPLLILEAPWLLALAMVLGAVYWWGREPIRCRRSTLRSGADRITSGD